MSKRYDYVQELYMAPVNARHTRRNIQRVLRKLVREAVMEALEPHDPACYNVEEAKRIAKELIS